MQQNTTTIIVDPDSPETWFPFSPWPVVALPFVAAAFIAAVFVWARRKRRPRA